MVKPKISSSHFIQEPLNVFLVEDHVKAIGSQAGDVDKKYHDNIVRAILTRQLKTFTLQDTMSIEMA